MISTDILESLDIVTESSIDSEISVMSAIIMDYKKELIMEEFIMESKKNEEGVFDKIKRESKNDDNKFITILKFIPRLVIALGEKIKKAIKDSKIINSIKDEFGKLSKSKELKEKQARVDQLNEEFKGKATFYVDEKSGKIKCKSGSIFKTLGWVSTMLFSTYSLFKKIFNEFDVMKETSIKKFIDDCKRILTNRGSTVSKFDFFEDFVEATSSVLDLFTHINGEIAGLSIGIKERIETSIMNEKTKELPDDVKIKRKQQLTELSDKITTITATIGAGAGVLTTIVSRLGAICSFGDSIKEIDKLADQYAIEYVIDHDLVDVDEIKKDNPKGNNESTESYNNRINSIAQNKALKIYRSNKTFIKLTEKPEPFDPKRYFKKNGNSYKIGTSDAKWEDGDWYMNVTREIDKFLGNNSAFKQWQKDYKNRIKADYVKTKKEAEAKEIAEAKKNKK